jgi:hypothetical protein
MFFVRLAIISNHDAIGGVYISSWHCQLVACQMQADNSLNPGVSDQY